MLISAARTSGASMFSGTNVTDFLEVFDDLCEEYFVEEKERLAKVYRYCKRHTRKYI
jgi:hypothetical protein